MTTLAEFLKEQAEKHRAQAPERERKREEWVQAVERLLRQIEGWLQQADSQRVLQVERITVQKREERLGTYTAPGLAIYLGARKVEVIPVARNVVGPFLDDYSPGGRSQGRVDITDGAYKYMLYRFADEHGEKWVMIDDEGYKPTSFDQKAFGDAVVNLLR